MYTDAGIKLWLSGRRGSTAQPDGYARDLKLAFSSLLKKVFEVSRWATLIQDPSARRTKDSQPSGFGFEYCASHVRFRVFQQTARGFSHKAHGSYQFRVHDGRQGCPPYAGYASPAGPLPSAAWAAARRAMGTRNGEHET